MKKFKSVSGEDVRIALMSGHVFIIGKEWQTLPEYAHADAYANKCISDDMLFHEAVKEEVVNPDMPEALQKTEIDSALLNEKAKGLELAKQDVYNFLKDSVEKATTGVFAKNGKVIPSAVKTKMKVTTSNSIIQEAWAELKNDMAN